MAGWHFYETISGSSVVSEEVRAILPGRDGRVALGALLDRIESGQTLPRDVGHLDGDLYEARLTWEGQEFRVHFAHSRFEGAAVLLAVRAVNKKTQKVRKADLRVSKGRLADWKSREGLS